MDEVRHLDWGKCDWFHPKPSVMRKVYQGSSHYTISMGVIQPGHVPGPHKHDYEQSVVILKGKCDFHVDDKVYTFDADLDKDGGLCFMTDQKSLRTRLKDGETVFGMFYKLNSPLVTEIMGWSGLDFIVVDCEHSAIGYESVEDIVRTGENVGLSTIIRVPSASEEHIFHALDCGATGVQIPNMTTVEQFRENVKSAKYYPEGTRGLSRQTRNAMYGFWDEKAKPYVEASNEKSLVVVHIENKEMADAAEEICQIPQIDVVFVGPADMSQSLGIPGKSTDPRVVEVAAKVLKTAEKYGKAGGINVTSKADMERYIDLGARYILYSSDTAVFSKTMKELAAQFAPYRKTN